MKQDTTDYAAWVDKLVRECLPLDLLVKILKLQPLTKTEAQKFINVIQLAAQAKGLNDHREMLRQLRNICDSLRKSHMNEREILSWVSGEPEKHQPRDKRRISSTKQNMVYVTASAIYRQSPDRTTEIGMKFFNTFKDIPDAYDDFNSFMKQVRRTLATFKT